MIKTFFVGLIMGIANVIPGVSGGTLAVSFNIYDRLIAVVSDLRHNLKKELPFLISLGLGLVVAVLAFSNIVVYLLEYYPIATNFFFLGVILGSIPLIYKKAVPKGKIGGTQLIPLVLCLGLMVVIAMMPESANQGASQTGVMGMLMMVVYGFIAAACMIIPGISGSFVLMLLGAYELVVGSVAQLNIILLIPLGIGIVLGIVLCAKLIDMLLKKYAIATYAGILGFVIGSLLSVYPGYSFYGDGLLPFFALIFGFVVTYCFNMIDSKHAEK